MCNVSRLEECGKIFRHSCRTSYSAPCGIAMVTLHSSPQAPQILPRYPHKSCGVLARCGHHEFRDQFGRRATATRLWLARRRERPVFSVRSSASSLISGSDYRILAALLNGRGLRSASTGCPIQALIPQCISDPRALANPEILMSFLPPSSLL